MNYQDLAEHIGSLVALLGIFAGICGFLVWRMFCRVEKKLDEVLQFCCECQRESMDRFVPKKEYRDERDALWNALNSHGHSREGRVVR